MVQLFSTCPNANGNGRQRKWNTKIKTTLKECGYNFTIHTSIPGGAYTYVPGGKTYGLRRVKSLCVIKVTVIYTLHKCANKYNGIHMCERRLSNEEEDEDENENDSHKGFTDAWCRWYSFGNSMVLSLNSLAKIKFHSWNVYRGVRWCKTFRWYD